MLWEDIYQFTYQKFMMQVRQKSKTKYWYQAQGSGIRCEMIWNELTFISKSWRCKSHNYLYGFFLRDTKGSSNYSSSYIIIPLIKETDKETLNYGAHSTIALILPCTCNSLSKTDSSFITVFCILRSLQGTQSCIN